jgi:hypothetical protein
MPSNPKAIVSQVKRLVRKGHLKVRDNALFDANADFAWDYSDIRDVLLALHAGDYYKSEPSECVRGQTVHFFKARSLRGQDVYIHLYVDDGQYVVLNSFKSLGE